MRNRQGLDYLVEKNDKLIVKVMEQNLRLIRDAGDDVQARTLKDYLDTSLIMVDPSVIPDLESNKKEVIEKLNKVLESSDLNLNHKFFIGRKFF